MKKLLFCFVLILFFASFASATDIAYVARASNSVQPRVVDAIEDLGYSYDIILNSQIAGTNFDNYKMIIVMDELLSNKDYLPILSKKSLVANTYYVADWRIADYTGSLVTSTYAIVKIRTPTEISDEMSNPIQAYDQKQIALDTLPYPYKRAQGLVNTISTDNHYEYPVIGIINAGGKLFPSGYATERLVYFGLTQSEYWTPQAETLFKNSIEWLLLGSDDDGDGVPLEDDCNDSDSTKWQLLEGYFDFDGDGFGAGDFVSVCSGDFLPQGYFSDSLDCNDNNENVSPNGIEIPYDNIDNDCDGWDLADVDDDGYCKTGYEIQNKTIQCDLENGNIGTDCDDEDKTFNLGSDDIFKNCKNDAPIFTSASDKIIVKENDLVELVVHAVDSENDDINYSINDTRFINNGNGNFSWQTNYRDSGIFFVEVVASDGILSNKTTIEIEILDKNQAPVCVDIPDLVWEEDTTAHLNLSEYCSDLDGDELFFGVYDTSINKEIILDSISDEGVAIFSVSENWVGDDWIVFNVTDGEDAILTNEIVLNVTAVNDLPKLVKQFENISWKENANLTNYLNLSEYFSDIDSELSYYVSGNHNINILIDDDNLVSFYPEEDFYGSENIVFYVGDESGFVYSNAIILNISHINRAPVFLPIICETEIKEDEGENNCFVEATDLEGDDFVFSVFGENNMQCYFVNNKLNYISANNYNGPASCVLSVEDSFGSNNIIFDVSVIPVNDEPEIRKQFENISWKENANLTNHLNLSEYFYDIDSELSYSVQGNYNIEILVGDNGLVSFYPEEDFYGSESIIFQATDGEYVVYGNPITLNVLVTNKAPVFLPIICETEIKEDEEYDCIINATDREGDEIHFSVEEKTNLQCVFEDNLLKYKSLSNYNGPASCILSVSDEYGFRNILFNVNISPTNDAPEIIEKTPSSSISLRVNQQQEFLLTTKDIDGDSLKSAWLLNGNEITKDIFSYSFNPTTRGNYILEALVFDSEFNVSALWNIFVGDETDFTCSQNGGNVCSADEFCPSVGRIINSSDSDSCCSVGCQKNPPKFLDIKNRCVNINNGIEINFAEPDSDEEYTIGSDKEIDVELEIANNLGIDRDFEVEVYLYDLTNDKVVVDYSDDLDVDSEEEESVEFALEIDDDLDEENNYVVFAHIVDGDYCSESYQPIFIGREEDALVFEDIEAFAINNAGENYLDVKVDVKNIGQNDEDFFVKVTNSELKIDFQTEEFEINEGDDDSVSFSILLPQEIEPKEYDFMFVLDYEDGKETITKKVLIEENKQIQANMEADQEITLGYKNEAFAEIKDDYGFVFIPLLIILSLIVFIISVIYLKKRT